MRRPPANIDDTPARAAAAAAIAEQRSLDRLPLLYRMLLHSPSVATGWNELGSSIRYSTTLEGRLRELLICFVARSTGSSYEWEVHAPIARAAGVSDATLAAPPRWSDDPDLTERERAALTLAGHVLHGTVDDLTFGTAEDHFDQEKLLEIVAVSAYYLAVSRFLQAFGIVTEDRDT